MVTQALKEAREYRGVHKSNLGTHTLQTATRIGRQALTVPKRIKDEIIALLQVILKY